MDNHLVSHHQDILLLKAVTTVVLALMKYMEERFPKLMQLLV
jgi:hypothetical protein